MTANSEQQREWQALYDRIVDLWDNFGQRDAFGKGDYWLLDENWGRNRQELEFQNLRLLQPAIIKSLQALLVGFPNWYITARVDVASKDNTAPAMGLIIYPDEIVDDLQRDYLPLEFRDFVY
jgi:hypothetical protein